MSASSRSDPSLDQVGRAAEVERLGADLDRLHHGGAVGREVVVTLIPERGRSDPVYAVAQVGVVPGDASWSGPFDQQTRYGMCRH
jgi:hypothetical protein